jgi:NAD(P)-dependent dehydrogenase (short-subunit alcohol dehydrogenase family)
MAVELGPHSVSVNAVVPGTIATPLTDRVGLDDDGRARLLQRTPVRRMGTPEEVAEVVAWLATAPEFLTGTGIVIDGGYEWEGTP